MAKILIVDDSAFARERYKKLFESGGHEVVGGAGDGEQAMALYKSLKPELVTLDYHKANMTGEDVLKEIMALDPEAKVIMISGVGDESIGERALQAGAKAFFEKFHTNRDILQVIDQVLEH